MTATARKPANLPADPARAAAARAVLEQMFAYYDYEAPVRAEDLRDAA